MADDIAIIQNEILSYLPPTVKNILLNLKENIYPRLEEIRLRSQKPLVLRVGDQDYTAGQKGNLTTDLKNGYRVTGEDLYRTIASISDNSLYAFDEEIRRGFITIPGGHRVGLAGQVVAIGNEVKLIKDFSSVCFRIAREIKNCAQPLLPYICPRSHQTILNTLIISPPRCGKTTILRDLARVFSNGEYSNPQNVVVVDERSEIAGCYYGVPQLDVGIRTDVLDSCPKAIGMIMAVRSLSPQVIVTDEMGRREDIEAIQECVNAGVAVIGSIHAGSLEELEKRPLMQQILALRAFKVGVVLSRRPGPGHIEEIIRWG